MKPDRFRTIDRKELLISLVLCLLVLARYEPVRDYGFVNFDDPLYVTENLRVQAGLTMEGLSRVSAREERREKGLDRGTH